LFAVGDLGGSVKAPGSGDAGTAGQAQAGQTSQGLFSPGREPNGRSGVVTTVTLAIQAFTESLGKSFETLPRQSVSQANHDLAGRVQPN
jgi:hypothetical protein